MAYTSLLKKKQDWKSDNLLSFPNMDDLLKARNTADSLVLQAQKIAKTLNPFLLHPELESVTDKDELIGVREVARLMGVCERTVGHYRENGKIACIKLSERKFMFRKKDILAFINRSYKRPQNYCD
jgi:hypothetical protein